MSEQSPAGSDLGTTPSDEWTHNSGDPASVQLPPSRLATSKTKPKTNVAAAALAVVGIVVLYIWDDLVLAAPIIAVAGWLGAWVSFLIFTGLYGLGSFGLAMLAVAKYDEHSKNTTSRLAKFIEVQTSGRRGRFARRLVDGGKVVGFVVSSVALGAIATTWLIRYAGRARGITQVAALSSAIFAVSFVGGYAGIAALVF